MGEHIVGELKRAKAAEAVASRGSFEGFEYHKEPFPLDWRHDGVSLLLASLGLIVAASGGIGGGGILVPLFMLALESSSRSTPLHSPISPFSAARLPTLWRMSGGGTPAGRGR
ncbi:unnamed protein product [Effrenium voratum]|nr:unnamed protein product [Effrenium voratum]